MQRENTSAKFGIFEWIFGRHVYPHAASTGAGASDYPHAASTGAGTSDYPHAASTGAGAAIARSAHCCQTCAVISES